MALHLVRADDPRRSGPDLLAAWEAFMRASGMAPSSVSTRLRSVRALMRHAGVSDPLQLTRADVVAWLGKPVKPWTRTSYWRTAGRFSQFLREFGHDPASNLTESIPAPPTPQPVARPIDDATVDRLLALRLPVRAHAYVRVALYQAMRVHEIAKLQAEDFDLEAGWLRIIGKGNHEAVIPIHPEIAKLADSMPAVGYWFPSAVNPLAPVSPRAVSNTITNALRMAGSNATAHQLRDTAATRLQRTTRDIRLTQSLLRHRSIRSTQKYTEASNTELQQAVRSLGWGDMKALDWTDMAQRNGPPVNVEAMSDQQLHDLAGQLLAALARRQDGTP